MTIFLTTLWPGVAESDMALYIGQIEQLDFKTDRKQMTHGKLNC